MEQIDNSFQPEAKTASAEDSNEQSTTKDAKESDPETITWFQTKDEVHLRYIMRGGIQKGQITVRMKKNKLYIKIPDEFEITRSGAHEADMSTQVRGMLTSPPDGALLFRDIDLEEVNWTIERNAGHTLSDGTTGDVLYITMRKKDTVVYFWTSLLKDVTCPISLVTAAQAAI